MVLGYTGAWSREHRSPKRTYSAMATPFPQRITRISLLALVVVALVGLGLAHALPAQAATPYVVTNCTVLALVDAMNFMDNNTTTHALIRSNCNNVPAATTTRIGYACGYIVGSRAAN